jgi:hypothetical protein
MNPGQSSSDGGGDGQPGNREVGELSSSAAATGAGRLGALLVVVN